VNAVFPGPALATAAQRIEATLDDVFSAADRLREAVQSIWQNSAESPVTPADLATLQPLINQTLLDQPHLSGCGFVAELDVLEGPRRYWEWWTPSSEGAPTTRPLLLRTSENDASSYAYESMAWFAGARQGARTVVGPYLDFAGAERFVITCAEPVMHNGTFIGVTGADVLVSLLEPIFLGHLRGLEKPCVLINRESRVVTSNSPEFVPGERFRADNVDRLPVDTERASWTLCQLT
jgi:hypothetical protein